MNKIIAIIPARYQSSRFPGKPLALICNKPMIQHVYERAMACPELEEVYVATDDKRIFSCIKDFGGNVIITAKEHASGTDRIFEAAVKLKLMPNDIIINIQGDQPVFDPCIISLITKPFKQNESIDISTLKYPIINIEDILDPNCVKVVTDKNDFALYFSRSPIPWLKDKKEKIICYKHLGFYGYKMSFLEIFVKLPESKLEKTEKLEQLRALENGYKIKVITSPYNSVEVNTPEDLKKAEKVICSQ